MSLLRLLFLLLALAPAAARAHEVRPAYLELRETAPETYAVTWKQPASGEMRLALRPVLPPACTAPGPRSLEAAGGSVIERWRVRCPGGLGGAEVTIAGLERTLTSAYVELIGLDGRTRSALATPAAPTVGLGGGRAPALLAYLRLGVEHILTGWDHLAFVAGLLLVAAGLRQLLIALTAFTVAHSLTLTAAVLGFAGLPAAPVEALIALSILFVGYEAVRLSRGKAGITAQLPWLTAFAFGLLHGFGFARALAEVGLPETARIPALLLFNLGIEAGQILVVLVLLAPLALAQRGLPLPARLRLAAGYALGCAGAFWLVERVAGVLTA